MALGRVRRSVCLSRRRVPDGKRYSSPRCCPQDQDLSLAIHPLPSSYLDSEHVSGRLSAESRSSVTIDRVLAEHRRRKLISVSLVSSHEIEHRRLISQVYALSILR